MVVPAGAQRILIKKNVNDEIHCGIDYTKRLKLEACWPGYSRDTEEYVKRFF